MDDETVEAARRGDPAAFTALWECLSPPVQGYVRSKGVGDADDVTSEVFMSVFTKMPEFKGDAAAFRSFVFTVAHHRVVDHIRRESRRRTREVADDAPEPSTSAASVEDTVVAQVGNERARALIESLAPDQRDVLLLRVFGDLTIDEIATILGKRAGAVKALQHRGVRTLRRNIQGRPVSLSAAATIAEVR